MIKVLVLDRVPSQREELCRLLAAQSHLQLVGSANSCDEAVALIESLRPDIALVSHQPPQLDSLEVTRCIMEAHPLPIIIISGHGSAGDVASTFDAIEAGALAVMPRPGDAAARLGSGNSRDLWQTIKVMSEVKVVRRWPKNHLHTPRPGNALSPSATVKIVAVGASTGGPLALATLLGGLPKNFPVPVVVVQHMSAGFMRGFVDWLAPSSSLPVHLATHGEYLRAGHVYMAPDGVHMKISRNHRVELMEGPPDNGIRPSVACLFQSVAHAYGKSAAAVLLTGMGRDGAAELLQLREKGALTFAQDKDSSIVHGMPGEAIKLGAAVHILPPEKIAAVLTSVANTNQEGEPG